MILVKSAVSYIQPQNIRSCPVHYHVLGYVCSYLATFRTEGRLYMGHNFSQAEISVQVLIHGRYITRLNFLSRDILNILKELKFV